MLSLEYKNNKVVICHMNKSASFVVKATDEETFENMLKNDKKFTLNSRKQIELLKWLKHYNFTGSVSDKDSLGIITATVTFENGKIHDLFGKYSCYIKKYGKFDSGILINITDGWIPQTTDVIYKKNNEHIIGFTTFDVHQTIVFLDYNQWIRDLDYIIITQIRKYMMDYKGFVGRTTDKNGKIVPKFGGNYGNKINLWYENSGLTLDDLCTISQDDWEIIYQEAKLFQKIAQKGF
jgi:hypothetical protein